MTGSFLFLALVSYTFSIVSDGGTFLDLTSSPWLDPESITVLVNGAHVDATPAARGSSVGLLLEPPPSPGDTVLLTADTLAIDVPKVFSLDMRPMENGGECVMPVYRFQGDPLPEGLYISGSKKLGVSVGSGGGITQGTELSIQGMLAPGISVNGRISDRDLPVGVSSSEALSELDRVYVKLEGRSWNAEMGDLDWEGPGPVAWSDRVSGFHGGFDIGEPMSLSGGYGTSAVQRRRSVFETEEGVQGPYSFASGGGVTPGSERVFLDGELLSRGSGADYEVDYAGGLVTFTTARLIRRDQRVEVSYYRQGDGFRRNLGTGGTVLTPRDGYSLELSGLYREDDTGSPLGFVMTPEIEEVLEQAGEDPSLAWIDGGTYVGDGNGSYTLDSLSRYLWTGPGLGDWSVEFQKPPEGPGDYIYDSGLGGYVWTGEGSGTHLPRKYITIPGSIGLVSAELSASEGIMESSRVHGTFSSRRGNLFDPGMTTRGGTLSGGDISIRPWGSGPLLTLSGRYVSDGFEAPEEIESDSDLRRWGLPSSWEGKDDFTTVRVSSDEFSLLGGRRFLETGGTADIAETRLETGIGPVSLTLNGTGLLRRGSPLLLPGSRGVFEASFSVSAGRFTPFIEPSYTAEDWEDSLSGGLKVIDAGVLHEFAGWRSRFSAGGEFDGRSGIEGADRLLRLNLSTRGNGPSWSAGGSLEHSTGYFEEGGSTSSDALNLSYSGRPGGIWVHGRYTAGGYISRAVDIVYTFVGEGNGDYSYDPGTGEYYPDPFGAYIRSFVPGEGDEKVLEAGLSGGFSWADSSGGAGLDATMDLSASDPEDRLSTFSLAGAFDTDSPGGWNANLSPFLAWQDGTLRRVTVKLSGFDDREEYSGTGITREYYRRIEVIPVTRPYPLLEVSFRGFTASRRRSLYGVRETSETGVSVDPVLLFPWGLDAGIELSLENRRETGGELDLDCWGFSPHASLTASGWNASADVPVSFIPGGGTLSTWFFDGKQPGWTIEPGFNLSRNLNRWFRLGVYYRGRKLPGSSWEQSGGIEGTVNF